MSCGSDWMKVNEATIREATTPPVYDFIWRKKCGMWKRSHSLCCTLTIFSSLWFRALSFPTTNPHHKNISNLLDNLLRGYDNSLRPDFGGPPTIVEIDIMVRSMGPISEVDMTYSMDCYFRQTWIDTRLSYSSTDKRTLALSLIMLEKIWKPDSYFYNGKHSYLHTITTPNKFVRLHQDGRVLYSSRLTVKASCPMNLEDFPMDMQRCPLQLGSFGYTTKDVIYRWNPNRSVAVDIAPDMKMSQFDLISNPTGNVTNFMKSGEYSFLVVSFHLQRHMGNFLIQVYGPCTLLVILSWVSFWLNREATADRISLGVMTILTMTFLGLEARTNLPKVPYPTALDFFVFLSFVFIFGTIIQFAIVHYFTKYGSGEIYYYDESSSDSEYESDCELRQMMGVEQNQMSIIGIPPPNNGMMGRPESSSGTSSHEMQAYPGRRNSWLCGKTRTKTRRGNFPSESVNSVSNVDRFARVFFPISFLGINVFYWYSYLYSSPNK